MWRWFALAFLSAYVESAVVGIDFGSEFVKVGLVRPGATFHIVLDETSKRKIPAIVGFDASERAFGSSAQGLVVKKSEKAYMFMQRLLGKNIDAPEVQELRDRGFPFRFVPIPGRDGAVGIQHDSETIYAPEDLLGMNFEHIKKLCEEDAEGHSVQDVVITVPGYWKQPEREAMITAAEIGGFRVLSLINQNTAAAIQYGIDRKYNETDPPHKVVIFNMGASATEATLVEYSNWQQRSKKKNATVGQFEVRGYAADPFLGGGSFDDRISKYLIKEWNKQHPDMDVTTHARAMAKLRKTTGEVKKVLSANKDTPVHIQGLFGETDFKSHLTREKFLDLSRDLLARVTGPVERVLAESGLTKQDIDGIVVVGGGVRVPAVRQKLEDYLGKELTQSLDGDEAMAMGAVFRAANLSTAFQVRKLGMLDVSTNPVGVRLAELPVEEAETPKPKKFSKSVSIFKKYNRLAKRKTVAFAHTENFLCTVHQEAEASEPGPLMVYYNVTGFGDILASEKIQHLLADQKPKVALSFSLSSSGIVDLVKAEATMEEMVQVLPKVVNTSSENATKPDEKKPDDEAKTEKTEKTEEKTEDTKTEKTEEAKTEKTEETKAEGKGEDNEEVEKEEATGEAPKSAAAGSNTTTEPTWQKKVHRFNLKITSGIPQGVFVPMTSAAVKASIKRLKDLKEKDLQRVRVAEAKNKLESSIYEIRGFMEDPVVVAVSTDAQRQQVTEVLATTESWLSSAGEAEAQQYDEKLKGIQEVSGPILFRAKEIFDRPQAINKTITMCNYTREMLKSFDKERPWIPEEDKVSLLTMVIHAEEWLANKTAEQEALAPHESPAFNSDELLSKLRPIAKFSTQLLKRVKPKEVKKKANATTNATNAQSAANDTSTDSSKAADAEKTPEAPEGPRVDL